MTRTSWTVWGTCICLLAGCQSLSSFQFTKFWEDRPQLGRPDQIAAIWLGGVDIKPNPVNGSPMPGFGGRILFLRNNPGDTIAVDGTLTFQLFEEKQGQAQPLPLEQWVIQPEHIPLLLTKDLAGWGYNVWLPWNTYAPNVHAVRMIVIYEDKTGAKLHGEPMAIPIQDPNSKATIRPAQLEIKQQSFSGNKRLQ